MNGHFCLVPRVSVHDRYYCNSKCNLLRYVIMTTKCMLLKSQTHQAYNQVTTYLRPKNGPIVERTYDWSQRSYDWSQRSWVIARGKSVAARSWPCSKRSHTGLKTRLRPICDRQIEERTYDWSQRSYDWWQR